MTALRHRMREDLQLRGLAPRTQQCYIEAVKHLSQHYRRAPDQITEEEIRQYFLYLLKEKKVAESTFRIHLYGIRFFYEITLQRPWPVLTLIRPRHSQTLPVVLSPQEVRSLLALVVNPKAGMCLRMIYACGLRLREGTHLQVSDIDPHRMLVHVPQGKGGKDRVVPLAARTLELLRVYWQRAPPTLVVPRSRPADASPGDHPPEDLQARGAPEWPRQRCLHPHAPTLLRHASLGARDLIARHPRAPRS
jgi:integrase/recombinase XerD